MESAVALHAQAVAEQAVAPVGGVEATDEEQVAGLAVPGGEGRGVDAGHVAEHVGEGLGFLVFHALAGDHRYRARRVGQGGGGLAGGGADFGAVARVALAEAVGEAAADDGGRRQLHRAVLGSRLQDEAAVALVDGLQAAVLQQCGEALGDAEAAVQASAGLAGGGLLWPAR